MTAAIGPGARSRQTQFVLHLLGLAYGQVASWRRGWYVRHPDARRRLASPVISVGNLVVGGSGKTPVVAALARLLVAQGERPAILSRGYARREPSDGVLVVSDTSAVLEPVERSGDEPQMLARMLAGVPVLVCADRFLAGTLAERQFGCTVHLLDDGFQHLPLARDVDLLIVAPQDFDDAVLPEGRLREPIAVAAVADAVLVTGAPGRTDGPDQPSGSGPAFRVAMTVAAPRRVRPFGEPLPAGGGRRALAVAGIARPERFFATAREQGWTVVKEVAFRDHHWFTAEDVKELVAAARAAGADVMLTTEKDAVRLAGLGPLAAVAHDPGVEWAFLPIEVTVEPAPVFADWLRSRLQAARALRARGSA